MTEAPGSDPADERAIVPEEGERKLALPAGMIHRGLEIVRRLEGGREIEKPAGKGALVECHVRDLEWVRVESVLPKLSEAERAAGRKLLYTHVTLVPQGLFVLREADPQAGTPPVYALASVEAEGLQLACALPRDHASQVGIRGNEERFRSLARSRETGVMTIPFPSFSLYYALYHPAGPNMMAVLEPKSGIGYAGKASKEANPFFSKEEGVQVRILYIPPEAAPGAAGGNVLAVPPRLISMVAMGPDGNDDREASRRLYDELLAAKGG